MPVFTDSPLAPLAARSDHAADLLDIPPARSGSDASAADVLQACAAAIVTVLHGAGRPLTALDLLEELGHRYRGWTSSMVRHTLAELVDHQIVSERRDLRPCGYALTGGQTPAQHR